MAGLKDVLNFGFGAAFLLKEKIESELDELVKDGKLKKEDAKEAIERAIKKGEESESEIKDKIKSILKESLEELGIATKDDIENLKNELKKG